MEVIVTATIVPSLEDYAICWICSDDIQKEYPDFYNYIALRATILHTEASDWWVDLGQTQRAVIEKRALAIKAYNEKCYKANCKLFGITAT